MVNQVLETSFVLLIKKKRITKKSTVRNTDVSSTAKDREKSAN